MASGFQVHTAAAYDQLMGRWSKRLAPLFVEFAGVAQGERVLDAGCGTGALTFELANIPFLSRIDAIDISPIFVAAAQHHNLDQRVTIAQGNAEALPFADGTFDRAFSSLVLHFLADPSVAIREMRRVVRPGGVVAAVVWDHAGGMPAMRMMADTVAGLSEEGRAFRNAFCGRPLTHPGVLAQIFDAQGLENISDTELIIRMEYQNFDDYWTPIAAGEGPLGQYVESLDQDQQNQTATAVRAAYEAGQVDGPRSFVSVAWACLGYVR